MGRPLRTDFPGAIHHVMNRGTGQMTIYRNPSDRVKFLSLVGELEERFGIEVIAHTHSV